MSRPAAGSARHDPYRPFGEVVRVAVLGAPVWLEGCAPAAAVHGLRTERLAVPCAGDLEPVREEIARLRPHVTVVFDPPTVPAEALEEAGGITLGVLVDGIPDDQALPLLERFDRLVSFDPTLTGSAVGDAEVWRAIPPPISDELFAAVRPVGQPPRAISIGRSTPHREAMLTPAKHQHDLLQLLHGVSGPPLQELMSECDVGVFVSREPGGGFGAQVGMHLAAGQLLLAGELVPSHGLERGIDYLHCDSADGLVWVLDRLGRFPAMQQRVRFRGRLKAEQYRASRLFARLTHDLLRDVTAFGRDVRRRRPD
jgi:hypothetical protein